MGAGVLAADAWDARLSKYADRIATRAAQATDGEAVADIVRVVMNVACLDTIVGAQPESDWLTADLASAWDLAGRLVAESDSPASAARVARIALVAVTNAVYRCQLGGPDAPRSELLSGAGDGSTGSTAEVILAGLAD